MSHVVSILFGAAFTVAVMWAIGRLLFARLEIRLHAIEHDLLAFITGGAALSFCLFVLCALNAARTPVFLVAGIAALALNWRFGAKPKGQLAAMPPFWKWLFAALFAAGAIVYLINSIAPEFSPDGQTYHLGLVYRFFREHGFHRLTTNMYASIPLGVEMLFLFAFAFGRNSAAATVHCCYLLALPVLILSYGRRIGRPAAGVCAALIVGLSPVVGIDGISAYNDVALATTAFALFYLLELWRENDGNDRLLIPIGLLAGFCVAIKLTGFVAPIYAVVVILLRKRPKALIPVASAAALIALPWFIKDWIWLGNPVSPFFNRIFPNPYIHIDFEDSYRAFLRNYDLTSLHQWLWSVIARGELSGQVGLLFLLTPLALLALRSRAGRHCLLAGLFFLLPYPENIGTRFLIPALPFVALGIAFALEFSQAALAALTVAAAVLALPPVVAKYQARYGSWHITGVPWKAALRITPQDAFLQPRSVAFLAAKMIDYYVPKGEHVWSTSPTGEAYCATDILVSYQSAEGERIQDILDTAMRDDLAPTWNLRFTFPKQRVRRLRLLQTAADPRSEWSVGEAQIFDGPRQLLPSSQWHLAAKPFPWDIALAFDQNPATRWRSWEPIHSDMHVDVDFGAPLEFDRVELHCSHDQPGIIVHPEACDGAQCTPIPAHFNAFNDPSPGDLRRLAMRTIKARGIDYLLVDDASPIAMDLKKDPSRWGAEFVAERSDNKLYKIQ